MEVRFTPELEEKLSRIALQTGCGAEQIVEEAVERFVDYDTWFLRQVDKGLKQSERGELLTHEQVVDSIEKHLAGKQTRS